MKDSHGAVVAAADSAPIMGRVAGVVAAIRSRYSGAAQTVAMLGAATFIYLMRQPSVITAPTFWAEDGTIFFKGAIEHGFGAVLEPYRGQVFLFQRVVAGLAAPLQVSIQPAVYAAAAVAAAVLSCGMVLSSRWRFQVPLNLRFLCMLALLCSPAVDEVYGILSNAHWWLAIGLLLLGMLHDPLSRRLKVGEVAFTAVTALSGFVAIYAIPSLVVRTFRNRSRHSLALLGVALSGITVELGYFLASSRHGNAGALIAQPAIELIALIRRIFGGAAMGDTNLALLWPTHLPQWWVWLILLALIAALAVVWIQAAHIETSALLLTLLGGSVVLIWALEDPIDILWTFAIAGRYFVVLVAVLYVSLLMWRAQGPWTLAASGLACVILAVGILSDFHLSAVPPADWQPFATCVEKGATPCSVVIPPGWTLEIGPRGH